MTTQTRFALTSTTAQFGAMFAGDTVAGASSLLDTNRLVSAQATGSVKESYIADALTAAYVLSIGGTLTAARTATFPNASLTVAGIDYAQTWTATQTFAAITATTIAASGVITSTVSTGTAPFTVASTTVVTNLNASALLGSTWAAPAAIGTGTPSAVTGTTITATTGFVGGTISGTTGTFSSLTSGRIPFASTAGLMTDASTLLYVAGTGITSDGGRFSGNTTVSTGVFSPLASYNGTTVTPVFQILGTGAGNSSVANARFSNGATGVSFILAKSRGTTPGTYSVVTSGDAIGTFAGEADDGTDFNRACAIIFSVTGTVGNNRTPGNIVFQTGIDAAGSALTNAMTITNAQVIQQNGTTEASAVGTANVVNSGGLGVAKRSYLGTIGSTFKGNVNAGVQDATAAVAGQVGEVISSVVSTYTNYTTTATIQQLTSIALTAGDWMMFASVTYYGNSATNAADGEFVNYLCDTTASATGAVEGETITYDDQPVTGTLHRTVTITYHENIGASKTKYLNGKSAFTLGNPQFVCSLKAVRIR